MLVTVGGYPAVPAVPGAQLGITSDGFFQLRERPQRVLVRFFFLIFNSIA